MIVNSPKKILGNILIVEDDPQNRELLKDIVSSCGYTVITAQDGNEAMAAIQKQNYLSVFTDMRLPGISGVEILKKVREIVPGIPVFVVSGHPEDLLASQNKACWPDMIISKPFRLNQIKEALSMIKNR